MARTTEDLMCGRGDGHVSIVAALNEAAQRE